MGKIFVCFIILSALFTAGCSDDDTAASYSVTYQANGADSGSVPVDPAAYQAGSTVTVLDNTNGLVKTGYSFTGWNTSADGNGTVQSADSSFTMPASNVTLHAQWTINQYTVTFDKNDASATGTMGVQTINFGESAALTANAFSKTGYSFAGWATTVTGDIAYTNQQSFIMGASNVTLYAKWTINQYTVTFDSQGGSSVTNQTIDHGATATAPADPTRDDFVFQGWFTDTSYSSQWNFSTDTVTSNAILYAKWLDERVMVSVPAGTFTQTDSSANSYIHTVSGFSIGKYEVTYNLWYTVHQWALTNGYTFANAGMEGHDGTAGAAPTSAKCEPVTTVNWRDVIVWCNAYSQMMGYTPIYCSDSGFSTPLKDSSDGSYGSSVNTTAGSFDNPYVNWSANGYRLPTEGEWQYAASYQDGSSWTPYNYASGAAAYYNEAAATGAVAWYSANSGSTTHVVGTKTANRLGIHDMSGNVYEWCWDWYGIWPMGSVNNYRGPASADNRIRRGGNLSGSAFLLQAGSRSSNGPYGEANNLGFRVVRAGL